MKYETPKLTPLTPAIDAIQGAVGKMPNRPLDHVTDEFTEGISAYTDWEV